MELSIKKEDSISIEKYWGDLVPIMAIEEMGELMQAISKAERFIYEKTYGKNCESSSAQLSIQLVKELADVYISLSALIIHYGLSYQQIQNLINRKVEQKYEGDLVPIMAIEEMGELMQAISKTERFIYGKNCKSSSTQLSIQLVKELADVYISLTALILHYELSYKQIQNLINHKVEQKYGETEEEEFNDIMRSINERRMKIANEEDEKKDNSEKE